MLSICEERVLKNGPPVTKAILKNQKYNIKTNAKLLISRVDQSISTSAAHRTVRESLLSYGSCYSVNK